LGRAYEKVLLLPRVALLRKDSLPQLYPSTALLGKMAQRRSVNIATGRSRASLVASSFQYFSPLLEEELGMIIYDRIILCKILFQ
jgi:hypothetical protein